MPQCCMNPKKMIAALEASGLTCYRISKDSGISQSLLSQIKSGSDDRATHISTGNLLADYAALHGIGPDGKGFNLK